jgi:hypothetical protein
VSKGISRLPITLESRDRRKRGGGKIVAVGGRAGHHPAREPGRTMKRAARLFLFTILGSVTVGMAQKAAAQTQTQLFDDFMGICINTNADSDLMEKVLAAGGIKPYAQGTKPEEGGPFKLWNYKRGNREYLVHWGAMHEAATKKGLPADDSVDCSISSTVREDKSFAAIKTWVGFPPSGQMGDTTLYNFYVQGTQRIALTKKDPPALFRKVSDEGNSYALNLSNANDGAIFQLTRITTAPGP